MRKRPTVSYLTLDCDHGAHSKCPGFGSPFGGRRRSTCGCICHMAGVVLPIGMPGRT